MPISELVSLKNVISKLKPEEHRSISAHIISLHVKYGEYKPKTLIILELLSDITKERSEREIRTIVCPDSNDNTFLKLLLRLKEKIYEGLLLDINVKRKNSYSDYARVSYELKKKRILSQMLASRGLLPESIKVINASIKDAGTYFFYNDIVSFLFLKHSIEGRTFSLKKITALEEEIEKYTELRNTTELAEFYYSSIVLLDRHNINENDYRTAVNSKIQLLQNLPSVEESPLALYYLSFLRLLSERLSGNYANFELYAHRVLNILNTYPGLQNKPRLANANIQLADASIFNYKFKEAFILAEKVKEYLIKATRNYFDVEAFQFYTYFYDDQLVEAIDHLDRLSAAVGEKIKDPMFINKLQYHKAYTLFMQKKYADSNRILLQLKELDSDKEGWNIGIRLLQIMVRLEKEAFDEADALISNLQRHINKIQEKNVIRRRDHTIVKILKALSNKGFEYRKVWDSNKKHFELLNSEDLEIRWNFFSPELIPFHRWFEGKALKQGYSLKELIAKR